MRPFSFRFEPARSTLAIFIALSREPSVFSCMVTTTCGLLLLAVLLSSAFDRRPSVMPMHCLSLLLDLVFSAHVWNDDTSQFVS